MSRPLIIGITGGSGSGKTSFIRNLRKDFSESDLCIISQDDYYLPREQQVVDEQGVQNFDLPICIDADSLTRDLTKLSKGEEVTLDEYVFNNEEATPGTKSLKPAPVIIVEGLFVLTYPELNKMMDIKIFIHAHDIRKLKRRILRDQNERNYPIDDVLYRYEAHVLPSYRKFIEPYKEDADLVINNNRNYDKGYEILSNHIKTVLQSAVE